MSMLLRRAMMMASSLVKHIVSSVTGLVSFSTNVAADMPSVLCEFAPVQPGSGDPSPNNVRPITGWTGITLHRTGKNIFNISDLWDNGTNYVTGTGDTIRCIEIPCKAGVKITCSTDVINNTNPSVASVFFSNTYVQGPSSSMYGVFLNSPRTITPSGDTVWVYIRYASPTYLHWDQTSFAPYYIQVEVGQTASVGEAYDGTSCLIDLDGTRYRGSVDAESGTLTITHVAKKLSDYSWTYQSQYSRFYSSNETSRANAAGVRLLNFMCSCYYVVRDGRAMSNVPNYAIYAGGGADYQWYIHDNRYTTPASLMADVGNQTVCFELASPITVQLTPAQVQSIIGTNNVWHNANGGITVEYYDNH